MKTYVFDVKSWSQATVEAESEAAALEKVTKTDFPPFEYDEKGRQAQMKPK